MARKPITQAMRREVARRVGGAPGKIVVVGCAYCNASIIRVDWRDPKRVRFLDGGFRSYPELDHVDPVVLGGAHEVTNLVPACLSCNRSKCCVPLSDWTAKRLASARTVAA